jgi:hypothetical protein
MCGLRVTFEAGLHTKRSAMQAKPFKVPHTFTPRVNRGSGGRVGKAGGEDESECGMNLSRRRRRRTRWVGPPGCAN